MTIKRFSEWMKDGSFRIITGYGIHSVVDEFTKPIYVWMKFDDLNDAKAKKQELNNMKYNKVYETVDYN